MSNIFRFISRIKIDITADSLEEAIETHANLNYGNLFDELTCNPHVVDYEFHSVQRIEDEKGEPIDRPYKYSHK
jgi:RNase P/RNase MRP subunit POP5